MEIIHYKRSFRSIIIEKILKIIPLFKDDQKQKNYDKAFEISSKDFSIKSSWKRKFNITDLTDIDNQTYKIEPRNGVIKKTIYYLHGGAYWNQPVYFHVRTLQKIAEQNHARIIMPVYPKSPKYHAADVLNYTINNYKKCLDALSLNSSEVTLMGDSAGGGLCLALMQMIKAEKIQSPKNIVLFSPWLDIQTNHYDMVEIEKFDPMLTVKSLQYKGQVYSEGFDSKNPLVSPLYADFSEFPDVYIFCGTHDILYSDVKRLSKANMPNVHVFEFAKMDHVFVLYPIPEAKIALTKLSQIL